MNKLFNLGLVPYEDWKCRNQLAIFLRDLGLRCEFKMRPDDLLFDAHYKIMLIKEMQENILFDLESMKPKV